MQDFAIKIDGMHCNACVNRVTKALEKIGGVKVNSVVVGQAQVAYDPARTDPNSLLDAVNAIGFSASRDAQQG